VIAVTGASGFVGRAVCAALEARKLRVVRIGRSERSTIRWPLPGQDFDERAQVALSGMRAVVNVAGENIGARWTRQRRRAIGESRAGLTAKLARLVATLNPRPAVMVSASAVGYYGDGGDTWLDESSRAGDDFLAGVAREWEEATTPAADAGVRVVRMRLGVVIGPGGMVERVQLPFRLGLGGRLGTGRQWMSWVALGDLVAFVQRAIDDESIAGAINVVSPEPVRNADFTTMLARLLGRPAMLSMPTFALRAIFGDMAAGTMLASQRARPARLEAAGFSFTHPTLEPALRTALAQ
jgi:uncharacterized protein (TIGR01777 family)